MAETITSRPYPQQSPMACERCTFGTGKHAGFCNTREARVERLNAHTETVVASRPSGQR